MSFSGKVLIALFTSYFFISCNNSSETGSVNNVSQPLTPVNSNNTFINDIPLMEKAVKSDSLNIEKRLNLAHTYYSGKELDKALIQFKKVFERIIAN